MLRFTRHIQQQTQRHLSHTHNNSTATYTHGLHGALPASSSAVTSAARYTANPLTAAAPVPHATPSAARLLHTCRAVQTQSDDFFDPVAEKAKMKERNRLKREAEAAKKAAEEAANPTPKAEGTPAATPEGAPASSSTASGSESASSTSDAAPKETVAKRQQKEVNLWWGGWKKEITELKRYIDANSTPKKKPKQRPTIEQTHIPLKEWSQDPAEKAAAKLKAEKAKEGADAENAEKEPEYTGPTALQTVAGADSLTEQRIERVRNALRRFGLVPKKIVKGAIQQSEALKKVQDDLQDKVEEVREKWETSQDPRVWRMRDMVDKVVGETDTGIALGEIMQSDPNWNYLEFLKEMEEIMIPEVIKAFRIGDMKLLKSVTEGDASRAMLASFRSREEQKVRWDDRILDIRGVDVVKASLHEDVPFIHLTFVCQHVAVEYDLKTGEMKDPNLQSVVQNTYYSWAIKRDYDSPYYDWKIFEFHYQNIQALI